MQKKYNILKINLIAIIIACFFVLSFNLTNVASFAQDEHIHTSQCVHCEEENSSPSYALSSEKSINRNMIFFKFQDDDATDYFSTDVYSGTYGDNDEFTADGTFDTFFDEMCDGQNSITNYFDEVSNGLLNINNKIVTKSNADNVIFETIPHNRTYFMPYWYRQKSTEYLPNGNKKKTSYSSQKNPEGYFDYELIDKRYCYDGTYNFGMYSLKITDMVYSLADVTALHYLTCGYLSGGTPRVCHVYDCGKFEKIDCSDGCSSLCDNDPSDGICCKCCAEKMVENNSNYIMAESMEKNFRQLYLMRQIIDTVAEDFETANIDSYDNNGYIDSLVFYLNPNEYANDDAQTDLGGSENYTVSYYDVKWNELLWSHNWSVRGMTLNNLFNEYKADIMSEVGGMLSASQINSIINGIIDDLNETKCLQILNALGFGDKSQYIYDNILMQPTSNVGSTGKKADKYNLIETDFGEVPTKEEYTYGVKNFTTECHEFSHLVGLPDLYVYNYVAPVTESGAVSSWSLMCSNTSPLPQFLTAYERETLGYLSNNGNNTNVVELTQSGYYNVNVTKGNDTETIAFKYGGQSAFPNQYFYIEYRNKTQNPYDVKIPENGLVVYRVDKSVTNGNRTATQFKYGMYVLRKDSDSVSTAALNTGESFDTEFVWQDTANSRLVDAGLKIEVKSVNDNQIRFAFIIDGQPIPEEDYVSTDFDNQELYTYLLAQSDGTLNRQSFNDTTVLNLQSLNLEDLSFLSMFDFNNLQYLNLMSNKLTNSCLSDLTTFINEATNLNCVCLMNNLFNLNGIKSSYSALLGNTSLLWGIQNTTNLTGVFVNTKPQIDIYWNSVCTANFTCTITKNGQALSLQAGAIKRDINDIGHYVVSIKSNIGEGATNFDGVNLTYTFDYCTITEKPETAGVLTFEKSSNTSYPIEKSDYFAIDGLDGITASTTTSTISLNTLTSVYDPDDPSTLETLPYFTITFTYNAKTIHTIKKYYQVKDTIKPIIVFYTDAEKTQEETNNVFYLTINSTYEDLAYRIYDRINENNGNYDNILLNNIATITYHNATYTDDGYVVSSTSILNIVTTSKGIFAVKYSFDDGAGNSDYVYKYYVITAKIIEKSELANDYLYNILLETANSDKLAEDAFQNFSYLNLSNNGIESIVGLEKLLFDTNVVIDLSRNKLENMSEITSFLSVKQVKVLLLLFNEFGDVISNSNPKMVFGTQCLGENDYYIDYLTQSVSIPEITKINDYSSYFVINEGDLVSTSLTYKNKLYKSYKITYTLKQNTNISYTGKFFSGMIEFNGQPSTTVEVKTSFTPSTFTFTNLDSNLFIVSNDSSTVLNTNILSSEKIVTYTIIGGNETYTYEQTVNISDTTAPTLTLNGSEIVYLVKNENFADAGYEVTDNYTQKEDIIVSKSYKYKATAEDVVQTVTTLDVGKTGYYIITYTAKDSSLITANETTKSRLVIVGEITVFISNSGNIELDSMITPTINYSIFEESDFAKTYKINDGNFQTLVSKIKITEAGQSIITFKFTSSYKTIEVAKQINVKDLILPTIELKGETKVYVCAGESYSEAGCIARDNSTLQYIETTNSSSTTDGKLSVTRRIYYIEDNNQIPVQTTIDTTKNRVYFIEFTAKDSANNSAKVTRQVVISTPYITKVEIETEAQSKDFKIGETTTIKANIQFLAETTEFDVSDVEFEWYVNSERIEDENGQTLELNFEKTGFYTIEAYAINTNENGVRTVKESTKLEIFVSKDSFLEIYKTYIFIGLASVVILFIVIYAIAKRKSNSFY